MHRIFFTALTVLLSPYYVFAQLQLNNKDTKYSLEPAQHSSNNTDCSNPLHTDQPRRKPQLPLIRTAPNYTAQLKTLLSTRLQVVNQVEPLSTDQPGLEATTPKATDHSSAVDIILSYIPPLFALQAFIMPSKEYDTVALSRNGKTIAMGSSSKGEIIVQPVESACGPEIEPLNLAVYKCLAVSDDGSRLVFINKLPNSVVLQVCVNGNVEEIKELKEEKAKKTIYRAQIMNDGNHCVFKRFEVSDHESSSQYIFKFNMLNCFIEYLHHGDINYLFTFFEKDGKAMKIIGKEEISVEPYNEKQSGPHFNLNCSKNHPDMHYDTIHYFSFMRSSGLAVSPDGNKLFSRVSDGLLVVWNLQNKTAIYKHGPFPNKILDKYTIKFLNNDLEIAPDGSLLAVRTNQKQYSLYRIIELLNVETLMTQQLISTPEDIDSMIFSNDGQHLGVTLDDETICFYSYNFYSDNTLEEELRIQVTEKQKLREAEKRKEAKELWDKEKIEMKRRKEQQEAAQKALEEAQKLKKEQQELAELLGVQQALKRLKEEEQEQRKKSCCKNRPCTIL